MTTRRYNSHDGVRQSATQIQASAGCGMGSTRTVSVGDPATDVVGVRPTGTVYSATRSDDATQPLVPNLRDEAHCLLAANLGGWGKKPRQPVVTHKEDSCPRQ